MKSTPASGGDRPPSTGRASPRWSRAGSWRRCCCSSRRHLSAVPENRQYLAALLDELAGLPLAVEFRHASWAADRVFAELERRRVVLVAVDAPDLPALFPTLDVVTNPDAFLHPLSRPQCRADGVRATCRNSSTMITGMNELCRWIDEADRKNGAAGGQPASSFSIITFAPRRLKTPGALSGCWRSAD